MLLIAGLFLRPWYQRYVAADYAETCNKLNYSTFYFYCGARNGDPEKYNDPEACRQLIREIILSNYHEELDEELSTDRLCRSGGRTTFTIDPETLHLNMVCDIHGDQFDGYTN